MNGREHAVKRDKRKKKTYFTARSAFYAFLSNFYMYGVTTKLEQCIKIMLRVTTCTILNSQKSPKNNKLFSYATQIFTLKKPENL